MNKRKIMKLWLTDTKTATHRLINMQCEMHSDYTYLGDLDDNEIRAFFLDVQSDIDVEKNLKLLHYYGYLHLFIITKN
jgi:hypothetical protein